ncbi:hypothetical protein ACFL5F_01205 [Planctomycetota bacterium]
MCSGNLSGLFQAEGLCYVPQELSDLKWLLYEKQQLAQLAVGIERLVYKFIRFRGGIPNHYYCRYMRDSTEQ